MTTQKPGPQTAQALDLCAQLKRIEAEQARLRKEQLAAQQQRERLAETLDFIQRCEAASQTAARQRRRAALTRRYGPTIFTN